MVKFKIETEISTEEAIQRIRDYIQNLDEHDCEFEVGEVVILDTGWLGVVHSIDEGSPSVCYIDDNGDLGGPAYGYSLRKFEEDYTA